MPLTAYSTLAVPLIPPAPALLSPLNGDQSSPGVLPKSSYLLPGMLWSTGSQSQTRLSEQTTASPALPPVPAHLGPYLSGAVLCYFTCLCPWGPTRSPPPHPSPTDHSFEFLIVMIFRLTDPWLHSCVCVCVCVCVSVSVCIISNSSRSHGL